MLKKCFSRALLPLLCFSACIGLAHAEGPVRAEAEAPATRYSLPVRIVEQPAPSDSERALAKASEEREIANLQTQQRMVLETRKMVWVSIAQFVLAVMGTIALVITLIFNRTALATTSSALRHERKISRIELRSYISVNAVVVDRNGVYAGFSTGRFPETFITVNFQNFGQTPATNVAVFGYVMLGVPGERCGETAFENPDQDLFNLCRLVRPLHSRFYLCRDQKQATQIWLDHSLLSAGDINELSYQLTRPIYIFGRIYYKDCYRRSWRLKFCHICEPWSDQFVTYEFYNGEDQREHIDDLARRIRADITPPSPR